MNARQLFKHQVITIYTIFIALFTFNLAAQESDLYKGKVFDFKDRPIYISVVTPQRAQELFQLMAAQKHIPFRYAREGCFSRAHEMAYLLEDQGIIVGKAIAQGKLGFKTPYDPNGMVYWRYHIAPFLLVKKNGEEKVYIIDPSVLDHAAPISEWEHIITAYRRAKLYRTLLTNRFVYSQKYLKEDPQEYLPKNIRHARWYLQQLKTKQEQIDRGENPHHRRWPWQH